MQRGIGKYSPLFALSAILLSLLGNCGAQEGSGDPMLACPDLRPGTVCSVAESGFEYSDGCNHITCLEDGRASTTFMACQEPREASELAVCNRLSRVVWSRLGPFTCVNIQPVELCTSRGPGFAFSDGCNRIRCLANGEHVSTRMACPVVDPTSPYCRYADETATQSAGGTDRPEPRTDVVVEEAQFACPSLHHSRVCQDYLPAFSYRDGCRNVTCISNGGIAQEQPPHRECPQPEPDNPTATAYCLQAERGCWRRRRARSFTPPAWTRIASVGCGATPCWTSSTVATAASACRIGAPPAPALPVRRSSSRPRSLRSTADRWAPWFATLARSEGNE